MTQAKHTPGPWEVATWIGTVKGGAEHRGLHGSVWKGDLLICPTGLITDPDALPNARLIAASPELLAFAQWLINAWEGEGMPNPAEIAHTARAVIAKATGDTHG